MYGIVCVVVVLSLLEICRKARQERQGDNVCMKKTEANLRCCCRYQCNKMPV